MMKILILRMCIPALLALAIPFFSAGCDDSSENGDDNTPAADFGPDDEIPINGPSGLQVNAVNDRTSIFFDGDFIGSVEGGSTRRWNVPTGEHVVLVTRPGSAQSFPHVETPTFRAHQTHVITIKWVKN